MTIRFKQGFTEKIIDVDYLEIEDVYAAEIHDGKWKFKNEVKE